MAATSQYLERHGNQYRVVLGVPTGLRSALGSKLKRNLQTDSLTLANQLKWSVLAEFRELIQKAKSGEEISNPNSRNSSAPPSCNSRPSAAVESKFDEAVTRRVIEILGMTVAVGPNTTHHPAIICSPPVPVTSPVQPTAVSASNSISIRAHYPAYFEKLKTVDKLHIRTLDDDKRALDTFERWRAKNRHGDDLLSVTTKVAKNFASDLGSFEKTLSPVTCKKYIVRLRQYWAYMVYHEHVEQNPFAAVEVIGPKETAAEKERPFTDDEVRRLLMGECLPHLKDLMMMGALTGARLDAIVELKVKHTLGDVLTFKAQKRESGPRDVPTHSALQEIIERRTRGKSPDEWLFPEYPPPKKAGSLKEHSSQATKAFTIYRRKVGVDEIVPGKRRSLVNFHSFRRWFITKAERAGQRTELIAAIVGHKRSGMTLGVYSGGPEMEQARLCVEAVHLPPLQSKPIPDVRPVIRRGSNVDASESPP